MAANLTALVRPGLFGASYRQFAGNNAIHSQSHIGVAAGRVIYGIADRNIAVLLGTVIQHGATNNRGIIALFHPHNIVAQGVACYLFAIDLRRHAHFQQVAAVLLGGQIVGHLAACHCSACSANRLAIQLKADVFGNIAIRSKPVSYFAGIKKRVIKNALQIKLNNINRPVLAAHTAHAVRNLQPHGVVTAVQVLRHIKGVLALGNGRGCHLGVAHIPVTSRIAGVIASIVHTRKLKADQCTIALNYGQAAVTNSFNGNGAGCLTATTATTFNGNNSLGCAVFQQAQMTVITGVGNVVLMAVAGLNIFDLFLDFCNVAVGCIHTALQGCHGILGHSQIIGKSIQSSFVCLISQQFVGCFLIIIITLQGVRQIAHTILQSFHGLVVAGLIFIQRCAYRVYRRADLSIHRLAICGRPLCAGIGAQGYSFNHCIAVIKC